MTDTLIRDQQGDAAPPKDGPFVRPDVRGFLDFLNANPGPKTHEGTAEAARQMYVAMKDVADPPVGDLGTVKDLSIPGPAGDIPARLFDVRESREPGPVVVFFHGGGFVIGNIDTHASFTAEMSRQLDLPVVSIDYRLAPEAKWPAAPQDCEAAARWIASNPSELGRTATSLVLSGDSAGGTLTITTAMALRDEPAARFDFVRDNPDLVATLLALRTELQMRVVMPAIVPHSDREPFMAMRRFEVGDGGLADHGGATQHDEALDGELVDEGGGLLGDTVGVDQQQGQALTSSNGTAHQGVGETGGAGDEGGALTGYLARDRRVGSDGGTHDGGGRGVTAVAGEPVHVEAEVAQRGLDGVAEGCGAAEEGRRGRAEVSDRVGGRLREPVGGSQQDRGVQRAGQHRADQGVGEGVLAGDQHVVGGVPLPSDGSRGRGTAVAGEADEG